ncbi:MAG TPA: O-antigen ligase family protein [Alphaproteobacteria bacterium]|nr:O-antigen ligase family protein [Alphaproteobacteria bacterium]
MMTFLGLCLIAGYLIFGRPFAYFGVPPFFPAETFLLLSSVVLMRAWLGSYLEQLNVFRPIAWWSGLLMAWGLVAFARGLSLGYDLETALKELAAHYYIAFFFIGEVLGYRLNREKIARFYLVVGALAGIQGIVFAVVTSRLDLVLPWNPEVSMFDTPAMISYVIVGLVAFSSSLGMGGAIALGLDFIAALANPGRAQWLSIILGCAVVFLLQGGRRMWIKVGAGLAAVVIVVFTVGSLIPASEGRGGTLDPSWIVAQVVATVDPNRAHEMLVGSGNVVDASSIYARYGTVDWRYNLWADIIGSLETFELWLLGHGYGLELSDMGAEVEDLRSPHNFVLYLLVYTGLVGVALYAIVSAIFVSMVYRLPASPYRSCLLGQIVAVWTLALFGNALEAPFVAVPFYLSMGIQYGAARLEAYTATRNLRG